MPGMSSRLRLGFLHIVPFDPADPGTGLRDALDLFRFAEELGFDSGWVRTRHLQKAAGAPGVILGALAVATERLELGNAVIPLEHENPFRLAEDLATADVLSGGRLRPGLSVHPPRGDADFNAAVFGVGWEAGDYGYGRIEELREILRGKKLREVPPYKGLGGDLDTETVQPLGVGLADRLNYGAGSLRSATWAGSAGLGLLLSNISSAEEGNSTVGTVQAAQIGAYRAAYAAAHPAGLGNVAHARVVVPVEGTTPEQEARYRAYAEARNPRTEGIVGEKTIIARDIIGSLDEIVEAYRADPSFALSDEVLFELPIELEPADWRHLLTQLATRVGPALGWRPRTAPARSGASASRGDA